MADINAGKFKASINGPYPCWTTISYGDKEIYGIRHDELEDLLFVVQKAMKVAREKLGDSDSKEVGL